MIGLIPEAWSLTAMYSSKNLSIILSDQRVKWFGSRSGLPDLFQKYLQRLSADQITFKQAKSKSEPE